ncbi:MAG TPA: glutamate--tRNA ligase [Candidatus Saccharimonadales bacterium]|jgi:glutamyl-tRNA synthetase|nr:glutamate--tRNA ligase [Candidatus Saccharimonadales bacterium]
MKPARTRFAPSPTGFLHVGGIRTALFAWLLARQTGGQFILRLEDTDKAREVEGSGQHIMDSLHWLGLDWDEGLEIGGRFAPYQQSQRLDIYKQWAQKLVDKGRAYADPYTQTEVEAFREAAKAAKKPFLFRNHRPQNPPAWDGTQPLRFKSDPKPYEWHDAVMGDLSAGPEAVDDFIILKSDGYPTYNFCHIIDDFLMECTHVMRSQEFVASIPKFLNLYEALEIERPILATFPYVMGPDGKKKLSKRDGAKDVLDYAREGYLPEAMINFMATLGWNDGTEQEIFTPAELIEKFSLERVQKGGAHFDEQRLLWMSGAHIRALSIGELYACSKEFWPAEAGGYDDAYKKRVLGLVQERLKFFAELPNLTVFFFKDLPVKSSLWTEHKQLKKLSNDEIKPLLEQAKATIAASDFSVDDLTARLNELLEQTVQKPAVLFSIIRIATTQSPSSPGLADTLAVLGRKVSLRRIDAMLSAL